MTKEKNTYFNK